jgi:hypothetical protein
MTSIKTLTAGLALALAAGASQAASFTFNGLTDDSISFFGSFSFADVGSDFSGEASLTDFMLDFSGQTYALGDADRPAVALFDAGTFLGVDFIDNDDSTRFSVALTGGFTSVDEAFFAYGSASNGFTNFGSVSFVSAPVSEPGSIALVLAGFAGIGWLARRRAKA